MKIILLRITAIHSSRVDHFTYRFPFFPVSRRSPCRAKSAGFCVDDISSEQRKSFRWIRFSRFGSIAMSSKNVKSTRVESDMAVCREEGNWSKILELAKQLSSGKGKYLHRRLHLKIPLNTLLFRRSNNLGQCLTQFS